MSIMRDINSLLCHCPVICMTQILWQKQDLWKQDQNNKLGTKIKPKLMSLLIKSGLLFNSNAFIYVQNKKLTQEDINMTDLRKFQPVRLWILQLGSIIRSIPPANLKREFDLTSTCATHSWTWYVYDGLQQLPWYVYCNAKKKNLFLFLLLCNSMVTGNYFFNNCL